MGCVQVGRVRGMHKNNICIANTEMFVTFDNDQEKLANNFIEVSVIN